MATCAHQLPAEQAALHLRSGDCPCDPQVYGLFERELRSLDGQRRVIHRRIALPAACRACGRPAAFDPHQGTWAHEQGLSDHRLVLA